MRYSFKIRHEPEKPTATGLATTHYLMLALLILFLSLSSVATAMPLEKPETNTPYWSETHPLQVVLMVNNKQNPFWHLVEQATVKAASDLNINLQVVDTNNNPLRPVRVLSSLVNSSHKPDAVLFPNMKNTGKAILELLEKHKIYSVIYDNGFSPRDNMGKPGQHYRYWLGEIVVNNYEASRQLTHELIDEALKRFPDQRPLPMVVLDGSPSSRAAAQRLLGMFDALVSYKDQVDIQQIFHTRYNPTHAYTATISAKQRYPEIRVIWTANDAMALKAIEALETIDISPGRDILVSGFDLLPQAREQIEQKALFNSYGGHFMSAAWGLVYLYDQLNGQTLDYRELNIPLYSGKAPLKIPVPDEDDERRVLSDTHFSDIDFSLYSHHLRNNKGMTQSQKYIFEVNNTP